ncbi:GMP/IMP nucleotidase [Parashewanella spongiae]|uniref:GMP/IMP nucleotidase n=1 Tax=Parashewanella spongiae TaxID=342950 RepID=A0A3A6U0G2_9GAMM|nr:GMP/IMP nucleotidase [Parashewanella spongiae]MCL1077158.1 GMP/IMP nucleotidase [Parashewanella spongiae]RJY18819.1 GMP/IMP nucleotidase [Parashewanella spongiae]
MLPWQQIDTVLLDMDGTLLDLHFDNHLWLTKVPLEISQVHQVSLAQAKQMVETAYYEVAGTLNWYSLDYWQQRFNIDIIALHHASTENIQLRADCMPFLSSLKTMKKNRILATNAHPESLALKLEHTCLAEGLDDMISSHETGYPKENPKFWVALFERFSLDPSRCLFIDDNENILKASQKAGVGFQLGIQNPDSQMPHKSYVDCLSTHDLTHILPTIN